VWDTELVLCLIRSAYAQQLSPPPGGVALAESLSRWVNDALVGHEAKERRLHAMADAVDGDAIVTSDPDDLVAVSAATGRHIELIRA
jgi:hypothetical protein